MPVSERHKDQKRKNLILLGILLLVVAMLFGLSYLKFGALLGAAR